MFELDLAIFGVNIKQVLITELGGKLKQVPREVEV